MSWSRGAVLAGSLLLGSLLTTVPARSQAPAGSTLAVVGVNLLPMDGRPTRADQTLIVVDGRIQALGPRESIPIPEDAAVFRLPGRWVVPGLIDMHVHLFSEEELPLYLDAGITTVRNMWGWDLHLRLREGVLDGSIAGPRIYTAGRLLDGDPPRLQGSAALSTPNEGRAEVARQARAGYDGIKVYDDLPAPVFGAVVLAARRAGLPVWGHPPQAVGIDGVLAAGVATIEHLRGVPRTVGADGWEDPLDPAAVADLALRIREAGTTVVPTLIVHESAELSADEQRSLARTDAIRRIPDPLRSFCCDTPDDPEADLEPELRESRHRNRAAVVAALRAEGVRLLVGSDTGNRWVVPGSAFHDELALLGEAGLSTEELLRAATRDAALELEASEEIGTLAPGMEADLLVLPADPLDDPGVLRHPDAVMVRGHWWRPP